MIDNDDAAKDPALTDSSDPTPIPSHDDVLKPTHTPTALSAFKATSPAGDPYTPVPPSPPLGKSQALLADLARQSSSKKQRSSDASPPVTSAKSYLPYLPPHILDDIAAYSDEKSLWALMSMCRSLRYTAVEALKPFLGYQDVTPSLPLSGDIFKPIDQNLAGTKRKGALRRVVRSYSSLFDAYKPAAQLLRELTVEVRSDDDNLSWGLIHRFARQLHYLDIHVVDTRCLRDAEEDNTDDEAEDSGSEEEDEEEEEEEAEEEDDHPLDVGLAWPDWLFDPDHYIFPKVTSLTLTATARAFAHFAQLAHELPLLRSLSLSAHERDDLALDFDPDGTHHLLQLPRLIRLTVSGNDKNVARILRGITLRSFLILRLIIHISNTPSLINSTIRAIVEDIMSCEKLVKLALYGVASRLILPDMVRKELDVEQTGEGWAIPDLTDLVLEFDRKMPILHSRPDIPALQTLTFVDKRAGPNGDITLRPRKLVPIDFYDETDLRAVFRHYKHLKRVQWFVGYPTNPFGKNPDWPAEAIACCVDRPGKGGSFEAFRPKA